MQDSLKDYIKIASNTKTSPGLNKEELVSALATAEYKKLSQDYAHKVVEFLIDGKLKPQIFTRSLNFIDISLYEDVVQERAITKLCGYPLCGKQIPEMPEKKYIILAKVNKIYDLTDRKNFCSNFCYKASCHIKNQVDNSPLWLRKHEKLQQFTLLEKTNSGLTPGNEILHTMDNSLDEPTFTSVAAFAEACLHEAEELEQTCDDTHDEDITVQFEPNENIKSSQSILKNEKLKVPSTSTMTNNLNIRKVSFIDQDVQPSTSGTCTSFKKQEEELNQCIQSLFRLLNVNVDNKETTVPANKEIEVKQLPSSENHDNIHIDIEKMNKVIEKVKESEKQRNKPAILIETNANPEITKFLEPPKYSQRLFNIMNKAKLSQSDANMKPLTKKNTTMKVSKDEDKMKKILEKIKNKNISDNKKTVILIDTVQNPEAIKAKLEENAKKQLVSSALNDSDFAIIKESFIKWLTIESFLHLYGEETLKGILSEEKFNMYFNKVKVAELETSQQQKYADICKKLHMEYLLDQKLDMTYTSQQSQVLKPVPDYKQLKEEVKDINLRVKAFYTGEVIAKNKSVINHKNYEQEKADDELVLPLADVSRSALRRSIFNKSVTKFIQYHVLELSLKENIIINVHELIRTFKLDASNIVFKPRQWDIIALILLYCLTKQDAQLDTPEFKMYITNFIEKLTKSKLFLHDITSIIDNVDAFVKNYIERNDL